MKHIVWFRRDLRISDNMALNKALEKSSPENPVQCLFIFDDNIIEDLPRNDSRISFIYDNLRSIHQYLRQFGASLMIKQGKPAEVWKELLDNEQISEISYNRDYEPYAKERDRKVKKLADAKNIRVNTYKDHLIFEPSEVLKPDNTPYTVYTPYKKMWLRQFLKQSKDLTEASTCGKAFFEKNALDFPNLQQLGFQQSAVSVPEPNYDAIRNYEKSRDFPAQDATGRFGPHLRFGTLSIRALVAHAAAVDDVFLGELIWREFYIQILFYFPHVTEGNFRKKYDLLQWRNRETDFDKWSRGETGFPLVDAGMRQLNQTGYMHNRVRMLTAAFLTKHLLIDWRWGEAYFAEKLVDYELASNNGNWQWAAGTGCDAAPYFRIFNPYTQHKKFDPRSRYVRRFISEYGKAAYPSPMVDHKTARLRALETYKKALNDYNDQSVK